MLELQLYNNLLAGVSLEGDRFFYVNPLSSSGNHERVPWFDCSCCPTNVVRSIPAVSGAIYARRAGELWVSLYVGSGTEVELSSGTVGVRSRAVPSTPESRRHPCRWTFRGAP